MNEQAKQTVTSSVFILYLKFATGIKSPSTLTIIFNFDRSIVA